MHQARSCVPVLLALLLAGVSVAHAWLDGSGNPAVNEAAQGNETFAMIVVLKASAAAGWATGAPPDRWRAPYRL